MKISCSTCIGENPFLVYLVNQPFQPVSKQVETVEVHLRDYVALLERLSMTFTADGKRQRLSLIFYSFLVILK